jgi:hypothetical protein
MVSATGPHSRKSPFSRPGRSVDRLGNITIRLTDAACHVVCLPPHYRILDRPICPVWLCTGLQRAASDFKLDCVSYESPAQPSSASIIKYMTVCDSVLCMLCGVSKCFLHAPRFNRRYSFARGA